MPLHFHPRSDDRKTASQLNWPIANAFVHLNTSNSKVRGQSKERKPEKRAKMGSKEWEKLWGVRSRQSLNGHRGALWNQRYLEIPGSPWFWELTACLYFILTSSHLSLAQNPRPSLPLPTRITPSCLNAFPFHLLRTLEADQLISLLNSI